MIDEVDNISNFSVTKFRLTPNIFKCLALLINIHYLILSQYFWSREINIWGTKKIISFKKELQNVVNKKAVQFLNFC